jgi:hypothetical protein
VAENEHGKDEADVEITVLCKYNGRVTKLTLYHINTMWCSICTCPVAMYSKIYSVVLKI